MMTRIGMTADLDDFQARQGHGLAKAEWETIRNRRTSEAAAMRAFNLVVTLAVDGCMRDLLRELSRYGEFHKTDHCGVIVGQVSDPAAFLESVRYQREHQLTAFQNLGRIVPCERCLTFTPETVKNQLRTALAPFTSRLAGQSFTVRLERRGLTERVIPPEVDQTLDTFLLELVAQAGRSARIDYTNPDSLLVIETFGERCGIGLLTREVRQRYPFVRAL